MLAYYDYDEDLRIAKEFCGRWRENGVSVPSDLCYKILRWAHSPAFAAIGVYSLSTKYLYANTWEQSKKLIRILAKNFCCTPGRIFCTMPGHFSTGKSDIMMTHRSVSVLTMAKIIAKKYSDNKYKVKDNEYGVGIVVLKGGD